MLLLKQITGTVWRSVIVAGLFAVHPLHVESVAWIAERKDLLSAFFGLLTLIVYAAYAQKSKIWRFTPNAFYGFALALFALGLMSKPMLVTWPFVMLLLDWWPLGRVTNGDWRGMCKNIIRLGVEKVPFLILAIGSCVITLQAQQHAMASVDQLPLIDRIANAVLAYGDYLQQMLIPTNLAIFYPHIAPPPFDQVSITAAILGIITFVVLKFAIRSRFGATGWFWYLGTLVPVIGLVQVGGQARADRYTYLPLIGIFILLTWAVHAWVNRRGTLRKMASTIAALALAGAAVGTRQQLNHWKNSETLFTHAIKVTEGNYIAWAGLGIVEFRRENFDLAIQHLERASNLVPPGLVLNQIRYYIGAILQKQGNGAEALRYFEQAENVGILKPERDYRYALSLIEIGRLDEAEELLNRACDAKPDNSDFLLGRATLLHSKGNSIEAEEVFKQVIHSDSDNWLGYYLYAKFLLASGRYNEADFYLAKTASFQPNNSNSRKEYALNLARLGKTEQAIFELQNAIEKDPTDVDLHFNLAEQFIAAHRFQEGIATYEKTLEINRNYIPALNNLAWLLATHSEPRIRDGNRAVELALRACDLTSNTVPVVLGTLAAAYAEAGSFAEAITTAEKARNLAKAEGLTDLAERNEKFLHLYRNKMPARD